MSTKIPTEKDFFFNLEYMIEKYQTDSTGKRAGGSNLAGPSHNMLPIIMRGKQAVQQLCRTLWTHGELLNQYVFTMFDVFFLCWRKYHLSYLPPLLKSMLLAC